MNASELNRSPGAPLQVNLVLTGAGRMPWQLGDTLPVTLAPGSLCREEEILRTTSAEALLFWDPALGQPCAEKVLKMLTGPSDLWHAGLCLGMRGLPALVDFVQPTWMFNCDPSPEIEATSWRVSLRTCLVRTEVLRKMGFLRPEFSTLEAAALEWGHRLITHGILMRNVPGLIVPARLRDHGTTGPQKSEVSGQWSRSPSSAMPFADELRFIHYRFGRKWAGWALFRAVMTRYTSFGTALRAWRSVMSTPRPPEPPPFRASAASGQWSVVSSQPPEAPSTVHRPPSSPSGPDISAFSFQLSAFAPKPRVSVVIPTIRRYPYLRTLLKQLGTQTVAPEQILIVDQTPEEERDYHLAEGFADLPIQLMHQDEPGQCASRNTALALATGDYVLFVDDDDEVSPDLIARHLNALARYEAEVSCGVVEDKETGPPTGASLVLRASDVFPTNNTLIRKDVLWRSGLFDLAYNRGARADGDLGMRIYLSGAKMVLNPDICLFHHHAPQGGLRVHGARVITRTSSRSQLWHRHLPSPTEMYLARRYFSPRQVRETKWIRMLGTFSSQGRPVKKMAKVVASLVMLPATIRQIRRNDRKAKMMLQTYPIIPMLGNDTASKAVVGSL